MIPPRLQSFYEDELRHIREVAWEFAQEYPKIAGRLALGQFECPDPYVERLLEGFAFLTARVQLKLDAQFPRFTHHLLELLNPNYMAPMPSMMVVQFQPEADDAGLAGGYLLPRRKTQLRSVVGASGGSSCIFRTAHDVELFPLRLVQAQYVSTSGGAASISRHVPRQAKAALRLRLRCSGGLTADQLALDRLPVYLRGADGLAQRLYEQIFSATIGVMILPADSKASPGPLLDAASIHRMGLEADDALLPPLSRGFDGYRLLQEYFSLPERFLFAELTGLRSRLSRCRDAEFDIVILFNRANPALDGLVTADNFGLFCTPAVNLFERTADRIQLNRRETDFHIVVDRTRPLDFEVHSLTDVQGYGADALPQVKFRPFFGARDTRGAAGAGAFYTLDRRPRLLSERERRDRRSSYVGCETFIALVDGAEAPLSHDLRQLGLTGLCSNRDLPLHMSLGQLNTDFTLETAGPIESIRCVGGPSRPRSAEVVSQSPWRLISHLSLNYLTLTDLNAEQGAAALRELLSLYADLSEPAMRKEVESIHSLTVGAVVRRFPMQGPVTHVRGMEMGLCLAEPATNGVSGFLLASVLEVFFARYASINSFTQTVLSTDSRGEVMRWPVRLGRRGPI